MSLTSKKVTFTLIEINAYKHSFFEFASILYHVKHHASSGLKPPRNKNEEMVITTVHGSLFR